MQLHGFSNGSKEKEKHVKGILVAVSNRVLFVRTLPRLDCYMHGAHDKRLTAMALTVSHFVSQIRKRQLNECKANER